MATVEEITGIENFIRIRIVEDRVSHKCLSEELMSMYPHIKRGLSQMSVRRFCDAYNIHGTSRLTDAELDTAVSGCIKKGKSEHGGGGGGGGGGGLSHAGFVSDGQT